MQQAMIPKKRLTISTKEKKDHVRSFRYLKKNNPDFTQKQYVAGRNMSPSAFSEWIFRYSGELEAEESQMRPEDLQQQLEIAKSSLVGGKRLSTPQKKDHVRRFKFLKNNKNPDLTQKQYAAGSNFSQGTLSNWMARYSGELEAEERRNVDATNQETYRRTGTKNKAMQQELNVATAWGRPTGGTSVLVDMEKAVLDIAPKLGGVNLSTIDGFNMPTNRMVTYIKLESRDPEQGKIISQGLPGFGHRMRQSHLIKAKDGELLIPFWKAKGKGGMNAWNGGGVDKIDHQEEDIVEVSKYATRKHRENQHYRTVGPRGLPYQVHSAEENHLNPESISACTIERRNFSHPPNGNSATPYCGYFSQKQGKDNPKRAYPGNSPGVRMDPQQYRRVIETNQSLRRYLVASMASRVQFLAVVGRGLPISCQERDYPDSLDNDDDQVWKQLKEALRTDQSKIVEWKRVDPTLTTYDVLMLEYGLKNGLIINHHQMAGHKDKSRNHIFETMQLTAKADVEDDRPASVVAREMASQVGQLMLPLQNHGYELEPGYDIVHLNLTDTVHVPDDSRGDSNYSMVQHTPSPRNE